MSEFYGDDLKYIPKGMHLWPMLDTPLTPQRVIQMYEQGFAGSWYSPTAQAALRETIENLGGFPDADDVCNNFGLAGSGAGKLSIPFVNAVLSFPGCYPGPAQERGDCVSHGGAGSGLITYGSEVQAGLPDEQTGKVEGVPAELTDDGRRNGVFSSEWLYWFRGYSGDGWSCQSVVNVMLKQGIMLRVPYPDLGIDLTRYSGSLAGKYGRSKPPENMQTVGKLHLFRTATESPGMETTRDLLASGYGIVDCGGEAWSSTRDANGVSRRQGGWSHSMKNGGFDDRPEIHQKYGGPLILIINNWGTWNSGPRDIFDSAKYVPVDQKQRWIELDLVNPTTGNIMIPKGSFWSKWSDASRRYRCAMSSFNGWSSMTPNFMLI